MFKIGDIVILNQKVYNGLSENIKHGLSLYKNKSFKVINTDKRCNCPQHNCNGRTDIGYGLSCFGYSNAGFLFIKNDWFTKHKEKMCSK